MFERKETNIRILTVAYSVHELVELFSGRGVGHSNYIHRASTV